MYFGVKPGRDLSVGAHSFVLSIRSVAEHTECHFKVQLNILGAAGTECKRNVILQIVGWHQIKLIANEREETMDPHPVHPYSG